MLRNLLRSRLPLTTTTTTNKLLTKPFSTSKHDLQKSIRLSSLRTRDVRFPTSKTAQGTDSIHTNPNYSAAYVSIDTNQKDTGNGIIFTLGKGTDTLAHLSKELFPIIQDKSLYEITQNFPKYCSKLVNQPQLRWLGPQKGAIHLSTAGIVNAIWDLWGKVHKKPIWRLLSQMKSQQIVSLLDFRYITDQLTPEEAYQILKSNQSAREERIKEVEMKGIPAYTTAVGWSGYSEEKVKQLAKEYKAMGFKHFKVKVGLGLQSDMARCKLVKESVGSDCQIMMDANQIWSVDQAIQNMKALSVFKPIWIEQPTAPDDVLGHLKISKQLQKYKIAVATGEHAHNRILHKHYASMGAYQVCQSDPCRLGGLNELILTMIMAKKFNIPVCLHTGGVGLCEMGVHAAIFDYIGIVGDGKSKGRITQYSGALHSHFKNPVEIKNGHYLAPKAFGYASDLKQESIEEFSYPNGKYWFRQRYQDFKGLMVPTFTPFNNDQTHSVNYNLTQKYASYLVNQACATGVWLNGSSGQFDSLTIEERKNILQSWMKTQQVKNGKLTLINHVGCNALQDSINLAKHSAEQKVTAIAVISPSYYKPKNEQQVAKWIHAIAKQVPHIPVYYYHIPMFNSVQCQVHKALKLARDLSPNVVGVKFTDTRFDDMQKCRIQGFNALVGADTLFAQALSKKADGIIGVSVNFMGKRFDNIYKAMNDNDRKSADIQQEKCKKIFDKIMQYGIYPVSKWLMSPVSGMDFGPVRLPMHPLDEGAKSILKEQLVAKLKQ